MSRLPFEWGRARSYDKHEHALVDEIAAPGLSSAPAGGRAASLAVEETRPAVAASLVLEGRKAEPGKSTNGETPQ